MYIGFWKCITSSPNPLLLYFESNVCMRKNNISNDVNTSIVPNSWCDKDRNKQFPNAGISTTVYAVP